jgi:hypothetical protein
MKRRGFIAALTGAAAWPLDGYAQKPEQIRRVGVLMSPLGVPRWLRHL